jgi:hypothetical protein
MYLSGIRPNGYALRCICINLLKPNGYYTYHQLQNSKILHADYIAFMCSVWLSEETVPFALHAFS